MVLYKAEANWNTKKEQIWLLDNTQTKWLGFKDKFPRHENRYAVSELDSGLGIVKVNVLEEIIAWVKWQ